MLPAQEWFAAAGYLQRHILAVSGLDKNSLDCFIDLDHKGPAENDREVAYGYRQGPDTCVELSLGIEAVSDSSFTL